MKKLLALTLALTLTMALVACGSKDDQKDNAANDTPVENVENNETPNNEDTQEPSEEETPDAGAEEDTQEPSNEADTEIAPSTKEDLAGFFQNYVASLGEDNSPMLMDVAADAELSAANFPGLADVATKQLVLQTAAISAVAFEFDLVEVENAEDAETVKAIFEARKAQMTEQGANYPATVEAWEQGNVLVNGNFVALIVAGPEQAGAEAAFNALFA